MDVLEMKQAVEAVVNEYHQKGYFPSASVRVFDRERSLFSVCIGEAKADSLFDVASLTKIATTTLILKWVDEGRIHLTSTVAQLFPEIQSDSFLQKRLKSITLYHLLTHTSTITPWFPFYSQAGKDFWTVFRYVLQHTEPVNGMEYSDLNFMLLGILCEKLSGLPLKDCLEQELVAPYALGQMMYLPPKTADIIPSSYDNCIEMDMCAERGIAFEAFRPLRTPVCGTVNDGNAHYFFKEIAGHAGIFANTEAYMRLCQFYMNHTRPIFKEAQREQATAPTRGLGFQTGSMYPAGCGHTGFTGTSIYFSCEHNIGVIAFTNRLFFQMPSNNSTNDFRTALHQKVFSMAVDQ